MAQQLQGKFVSILTQQNTTHFIKIEETGNDSLIGRPYSSMGRFLQAKKISYKSIISIEFENSYVVAFQRYMEKK